jgi:hypothetical protein
MRFLAMVRSAENGAPPPPELMQAIGEFGAEAMAAGVLVDTGGLAPSAWGNRIRVSDGELRITDGPFTESKEIVGGYAIYDVPGPAEALAWSRRFMELHQRLWPGWEGEAEVRQMFGPTDPPPRF